MAQINKPKDYFNTVLYTGTGSSRNVTGVGFDPDWCWIKSRSNAYNHTSWDVVRGAGERIIPNATDAEETQTNDMSAFVTDGVTVGTGNVTNASSATYAMWNWLAAGSTPSKTYTVKVVSDSGNKYRFDDFGTSAVTLEISEGGTYTFDQSDSSNSGHPLRFSTTSDGTHGGGSEYTTGVTTNGTPGSAGAYTRITVAASAPTLYYYCTNHSGMGGTANTPTTNSFSNFGGSIQSNISPNSTSLFSIVSYTGTGANATVGHGLGVVPSMIIVKSRNTTDWWITYHKSVGATKYVPLNFNNAAATNSAIWNDTTPTSSVFSIGTNGGTNGSSNNYIAYCFAEKKGYSKFGAYKGNGNADGPFVYTGFKPAFIMFRRTDTTGDWDMKDNKRSGTSALQNFGQMNPNQTQHPSANNSNAENKASALAMDILSNGFKPRGTDTDINASGGDYIYMAFAEEPLVGTNNIPATAR
jgi:hypothetical protein